MSTEISGSSKDEVLVEKRLCAECHRTFVLNETNFYPKGYLRDGVTQRFSHRCRHGCYQKAQARHGGPQAIVIDDKHPFYAVTKRLVPAS